MPRDFSALKSLGVGVVVNFRDDGEATHEKRERWNRWA